MDFLACIPTVFVIGDEYEILINVKEPGICSVVVGGERYYEENSGVLSSEKRHAKIKVPQFDLNRERKYTVFYRKTVNRKSYFSQFEEEVSCDFEFRPLLKDEGINLYHIADVHYRFDLARKTASYFGDNVDLYIFNGDIGEVESEENYLDVCRLTGDVSGGKIPVVFSRGNHDTRGRLAELYTDYFPSVGKNTYYTFQLGPFYGIVLDCGEDKTDLHDEYGGANAFHVFRQRETLFLKGLNPVFGKITFALSHICPADNTQNRESVFDIEGDTYESWNRELERLGVSFMLSGHVHKAYCLPKNSEKSLRKNPYPVIVGSEKQKDNFIGAAVTVFKNKLDVKFTDCGHNVIEKIEIELEN